MEMQTYSFTTELMSLSTTDGSTAAKTIILSTDADFQIHAMCGHAIQSNVLVTNWAGRIQIQEESSGNTWFNKPVMLNSIAGSGQRPFLLEPPKRVPKQTSLILVFTQKGTTATDVELILHGNKLFGV